MIDEMTRRVGNKRHAILRFLIHSLCGTARQDIHIISDIRDLASAECQCGGNGIKNLKMLGDI
jgi:hypothetical protein